MLDSNGCQWCNLALSINIVMVLWTMIVDTSDSWWCRLTFRALKKQLNYKRSSIKAKDVIKKCQTLCRLQPKEFFWLLRSNNTFRKLPIKEVRQLFDLTGVEVEPAILVPCTNKRHVFGQVFSTTPSSNITWNIESQYGSGYRTMESGRQTVSNTGKFKHFQSCKFQSRALFIINFDL